MKTRPGHDDQHQRVVFVMQRMLARGDTPILHAWSSNTAAIGLCEGIGFETRAVVNAAMVERE